ncbi:MAG: Gfo/Idh/MocA family oxidoreductase, partial [Desulfuromonadaceae bacterium]|nr:Gfo/Idh/MocA family oxidoreductase [Desulfuromonadaceae bacterium]
ITERVPLAEYDTIYGSIGKSGSIASLLLYDDAVNTHTSVTIDSRSFGSSKGVVAIIGAGNFTSATVLPALKPLKAELKYIVSAGGLTASTLAKRAGFAIATTDYREALSDNDVDLVMITTRHNLHAPMVIDALKAGKNVFVEKPLCLTETELDEIVVTYSKLKIQNSKLPRQLPLLTVGFNRRFAPFTQKMKSLIGQGAVNIVATMNAGFIPANSWVHDLQVGGGRIIGEACHFIDLCSYLCGSKVVSVCMNSLGTAPQENSDNVSIVLRYANGSNAVINYFANGSKAYSKERVEVHSQERSLIMDNWRTLEGHGFKGFSRTKSKQDKGHAEQFRLLLERVTSGGEPLIPFDEIINTTKASFAAIISLKEGRWVEISEL